MCLSCCVLLVSWYALASCVVFMCCGCVCVPVGDCVFVCVPVFVYVNVIVVVVVFREFVCDCYDVSVRVCVCV